MTIPVLTAKISIPHVPPGYIGRERLDRLWTRWRERGLWVVTAGAGYGKSSFLAARAQAIDGVCLWYSVDELDHDPAVFLAHLNAALGTSRSPAAPGGSDLAEPRALQRMLAVLAHALQGPAAPALLVFDDLHLLPSDSPTWRFLERFLAYVPPACQVVLASREPIAIATARRQVHGKAVRLTAADLAFREAELRAFFAARFGSDSLSPALARRILARTEGWAAGIEVLFQALEGTSREAIAEALDRLGEQGGRWFEYFAEEVLQRLDDRMQDFLMRSSIFPRLDPGVCNQVLGLHTSQIWLRRAAEQNIFTFALESPGAGYRYHHLFRRFLQSRLHATLSPRALRALYRKAARALMKSGAWAEAAACWAEAGDHPALLRLLERQGVALLAAGQHQVLVRALDSLPPRRLSQSPAALMIMGRIADIRGEWPEAEKCYRRALRTCDRPARTAELKDLLAHLLLRQGKYGACLKLSRQLLAELGRRKPVLRAQLMTHMGLAHSETGRLEEGERCFQEAERLFRQQGHRPGQGRVLYLLAANIHYRRGEFRRARHASRKAILIFRKIHDPRRLCLSLGVLGFITASTGALREARALTQRALRLAEGLEYQVLVGYCHHTFGLCDLLEDDLAGARGHFSQAHTIADSLGDPALRILPRLGLAECALRAAQPTRAEPVCREGLAIAQAMGDPLGEARARMLLGEILWETRPRSARAQWVQADALLDRMGAAFDRNRLLLTRLAHGAVAASQEPARLAELIENVTVQEHEFLLTRVASPAAARVLPRALRHGIQPDRVAALLVQLGPPVLPGLEACIDAEPRASDQIGQRLVEVLSQIPGDEARRLLTSLAARGRSDQDTAALEAIRELERPPAPPLHILALGTMEVRAGGHQLGHAAWRSARARRLLQLLLIHRFRWVPREVILDTLWPEAEPEKGANNLWQTMHVLRRTLEPGLREARQSAYLRARGEACRLAPGEGYTYDVEQFERAAAGGERLWQQGKFAAAEKQWLQATELYRGELFAESPYEEFAIADRERLREILLRTLLHLLEQYEHGRRWPEMALLSRRALEIDPYQEESHRYRVQAQLALGHRREALDAYHEYEKMMVREMGLMPTQAMRALAEQIVNGRK